MLANGSGPSLQGSNITQRLVDRGLAGASTRLKKLYDVNGAVGGPIKKDKLWFYFTSRYFTNESYIAGRSTRTGSRGGRADRRTRATGEQRHVDPRQQPATDLGDVAEVEDLRLVRVSAQGGSLLAAQRHAVA